MSYMHMVCSAFAKPPPKCPSFDELCVPCAPGVMDDQFTLALMGLTVTVTFMLLLVGVCDEDVRSAYLVRLSAIAAHSKRLLLRTSGNSAGLAMKIANVITSAAVTCASATHLAAVAAGKSTIQATSFVILATTSAVTSGFGIFISVMAIVQAALLSSIAVVRDTVPVIAAYLNLDILANPFATKAAVKPPNTPPTCCSTAFSSTNELLKHVANVHRVSIGVIEDDKEADDDKDKDIQSGWDPVE